MTQNAVFADEEAQEFQASPGIGAQPLAFGSAAAVGLALFFSSVLLGVALFVLVVITMNIDAGSGWAHKFRSLAEKRNCNVMRRVSQSAVIR
ncbi:hypothetical protein BH23ACT12_BH23ACT12_07140 [soil metagenome]